MQESGIFWNVRFNILAVWLRKCLLGDL